MDELLNTIYDDIVLDNHVDAKNNIDSLLKSKILSAIENQKQNVAASLFNPGVQEEEVEEEEEEEVVEEAINMQALLKQSSQKQQNIDITLKNGAYMSIDPMSSKIMVEYLDTLKSESERQVFLNNMINNERTFLKMFDIAKQKGY